MSYMQTEQHIGAVHCEECKASAIFTADSHQSLGRMIAEAGWQVLEATEDEYPKAYCRNHNKGWSS